MEDNARTEDSTSAPPLKLPNFRGCPSFRAALAFLNRWPLAARPDTPVEQDPPASRDVVRCLLSSLAPVPRFEPPVLSTDLERLNRIVRSVAGAVDEEILTPEEADAVINFIAGCFASRRLDEVIAKVTMPKAGSWFVVHNHAWEEG